MQPLTGVKVLDFGRALAGPFCSLMLADLGADVIKIEPPGIGDDSREWPPLQNGESCYFLSVNRNKRSIVIDLATEDGKQIVRDLVKTADVVVENFRPRVMERWGLGYEQLQTINPRLIYCAISGFGATGPQSNKPATDIYMQAFAGLMGITGEPGRAPARIGVSICDLTTGLFAAYGTLAALQARHLTGKGQKVDTSLLEGQMAYLSYLVTSFYATGNVPVPLGSGHPSIVPYQAFQASDGWVSLATFNDRLWSRAVVAMGLPQLADDPRYDTNPKRLARKDEVVALLSERFLTKTVDEWVAIMEASDVPLAPVNTLDRLLAHPQVAHREMVQTMSHPTAGDVKVFGFPVKLSDTPCEARLAAPRLGEHSRAILRESGIDESRIDRLIADGTIRSGASVSGDEPASGKNP